MKSSFEKLSYYFVFTLSFIQLHIPSTRYNNALQSPPWKISSRIASLIQIVQINSVTMGNIRAREKGNVGPNVTFKCNITATERNIRAHEVTLGNSE